MTSFGPIARCSRHNFALLWNYATAMLSLQVPAQCHQPDKVTINVSNDMIIINGEAGRQTIGRVLWTVVADGHRNIAG